MSRSALGLWILRVAVAGIYLFAAVPKILDPWDFARSIWNFRLLPSGMIPAVSLWLPALEALAALAVLSGRLYRGGLVCLGGLSLLFAAAIASAVARGLDIECGCFGKAVSSSANLPHLALNLGIVAAAILLFIAGARSQRTARPPV